ncbi:MAG: PKD domain-containing protein [Candidatus Diapherotrites archaeon]|nr:PKD domain-containing protein [Candidatus Diapherotrites archaeon]
MIRIADTSQVVSAAIVVGLFFVALFAVEISRYQHVAQQTKEMETYSEEKRFEESFDALLKMTEPRTKETIGELFANCAYYGADDRNYGGIIVNCRDVLEELFDSFYGRENYYAKIPQHSSEITKGIEIYFIVDTSKSMTDDISKIGQSVIYIKNNFTGDVNFHIYTLASVMTVPQCSMPNVECKVIPASDLSELCKQAGIPPEHCVLQEAYGLGVAWVAQNIPIDSNNIRILIPLSDELSCSDEFISQGTSYGGKAYADKSIDFGISVAKNHKNFYVYPILCDPLNVNNPGQIRQIHDENAIIEDMNRLANSLKGEFIDFSKGYSQAKLDILLEKIIFGSTTKREGLIEIGTKKERAERYSYDRTVIMPSKKPAHFTLWVYKERVPHQMKTVVVKMPPIAIINADPRVLAQEPYTTTLDGSASYDPDGGTIVSYEWDLNGKILSTQPKFTHTFSEPGQYKIKLTVTDDEGQKGSTTITIFVGKKPTFNFIFVPVNWSGSNASFESTAMAHFNFFVKGAKLDDCKDNYSIIIMSPESHNCQVSLLNNCMREGMRFDVFNQIVKCVQNAGYSINWTSMRIVAITKSDICFYIPHAEYAIIGFTEFGSYPTVCEARYNECSAHELGHQFYFCEQYYQNSWLSQNSRLSSIGGCKNKYPDGTNHCQQYGSLTTNCPEYLGRIPDCLGRKIPVGGSVGRSLMGPGGISAPRLFDCFEEPVIRSALKCQ